MINTENKFYTYRHIRLDTNLPFYIGKGEGDRAWSKDRNNQHWHSIVNKVDYRVEIIQDGLSEEEAFDKEKYFIKLYGRKDLSAGILINKTNGGEGTSGFIHSEKSKKKMSKANKGKSNPMKGKNHTEQSKKNMSLGSIGQISPMKNKKHSYSAKLKNAKSNGRGKLFNVIDQNKEIIWNGYIMAQCARELNLASVGHISDCLNGKKKSYKKYTFIYVG